MIDITTLTKADIGRKVSYRTREDMLPEYGIITDYNDTEVYVAYQTCAGSHPTKPEQLYFEEEGV